MIVTLTPNPSIDRTLSVSRLDRGAVHRATDSRVEPGGKGVNVTRALTAGGTASLAVLPAGGADGALLQELLDESGTEYVVVPVSGTTRTNVTVTEPDGTTTKLNEPGPALSAHETAAVLSAVSERLAAGVAWVVGSGSLAPGTPAGVYAALVQLGHAAGARAAVDSSGDALAAALDASPDLVKPNLDELEQLARASLRTLGDVRDAAEVLVRGGVGAALVSLGAHGALLVTPGFVAHGRASASRLASTVGAGDCLLAGYLHAVGRGAGRTEALATAVAWGSAAAALPGSQVPGPTDIAGVDVRVDTDFDARLPLAGSSRPAVLEEHGCP